MESMHFIFDGVKSSDMGLYIVRVNHSGFTKAPYWGSTNIKEEKSAKRITPYFYGVDRNSIEFTVQLMLLDKENVPKEWSPQERYMVAKWLIHDEYKEFQTSDDMGKRHYAMLVNAIDLNLINTRGYFEATFRTNSPFAFSGVYIENWDLSTNITTQIIELENRSNVLKYYNPKIEIKLVGETTSFQLKNLSNNGMVMKFENLTKGEIISIDCENRIIKSNLLGENPFSKFNKDTKRYWCDLVFGVNQIEVTGQIILKTKMQYPIAQ